MADNTEILRRRTFAIIASGCCGKTFDGKATLLFGGQIQVAGAVKSNKIKRRLRPTGWKSKKQRGISATTSVMESEHLIIRLTFCDTPGHRDLPKIHTAHRPAVDSVTIVVDERRVGNTDA